jgi:putative peptidoglycan lipid II flippase
MVVGAAILLSRLVGLVRQRVFAHFFGDSWIADAFSAALRLPNITQNLLGEGTLSASFIPVYARSLGRGETSRAQAFARGALGLLATAVIAISIAGVVAAPILTHALVPGFEGEKQELAVHLVRIFFPMTGVLALSAWCLGVLNSHRRFFLPYSAPIIWSVAQIGAVILGSRHAAGARLAIWMAYGALLGGVLQLVVQLPQCRLLLGSLMPTREWGTDDVKQATRALGPVVVGRGIVQLSALLDTFLASLLPTGANAALGYVQTLYVLPVSLFGVGEAAAALPEMARETAAQTMEEQHAALRRRLGDSLTRVGFATVPTTVCFMVLADQLVGALFQTGRFDRTATLLVSAALAAYSLGLLANASVRVLASAYYALSDTKTPAKLAVYRVVVSAALSYTLQLKFQIVGLCLGAATAGWLEALVLGGILRRRLGGVPMDGSRWLKFVVSAIAAAVLGYGARYWCTLQLGTTGKIALVGSAAISLTAFAVTYFGVAYALGTPDVRDFVAAVRRRFRSKR